MDLIVNFISTIFELETPIYSYSNKNKYDESILYLTYKYYIRFKYNYLMYLGRHEENKYINHKYLIYNPISGPYTPVKILYGCYYYYEGNSITFKKYNNIVYYAHRRNIAVQFDLYGNILGILYPNWLYTTFWKEIDRMRYTIIWPASPFYLDNFKYPKSFYLDDFGGYDCTKLPGNYKITYIIILVTFVLAYCL
jgi:hypothetical protein